MKRLRTTFTCLFLLAAFTSIIPMDSCQSPASKQKTDANVVSQTSQNNGKDQGGTPIANASPQGAQNQQNPAGTSSGQNANNTGGAKVTDKNKPEDPNKKMLKAYNTKSIESLGPVMKVNMTPDQKKAQEFYQSAIKKSNNGDQIGAIQDLTESLNLYRVPNAYLKRGFAEILAEDYVSALNDMNEAIKMNPNLDKAYFGRGICHFEQKDYRATEEDLKRFVEKDKTNAMAYNYLGGCMFLKQDFKAALENYEMVAKLDPKFPDVYTNRGMMKHYLKDLKGAIEDYNKALTLDPKNATAYNNRGGAKLNMGDTQGALEDFNSAIRLQSDYADAFDNRGRAKINLGNLAGACEDFHKAYSLGLGASLDMINQYCK